MQSTEGYVEFRGYRTWYRITGDLRSDACPLIVLHGGPGCTHDYVDSFKDLAANGRAVIHYDQLGNGKSTHLPDADPGFWTVGLFLDELQALITQLGLSQYALLGQSWGGMLAAEHAVRRPAGLRALVIANSPASMGLWRAAALRLRARLPEDIQAALTRTRRRAPWTTRPIAPQARCSTPSTFAACCPGLRKWRAPSPPSMPTRPCITP